MNEQFSNKQERHGPPAEEATNSDLGGPPVSVDSFARLLMAATPQASDDFQRVLFERMLGRQAAQKARSVAGAADTSMPCIRGIRSDETGPQQNPNRRTEAHGLRGQGNGPVRFRTLGQLGSFSARLVGALLLVLLAAGMVALLEARQGAKGGSNKASGTPIPGLIAVPSDQMALRMQVVNTLPSKSSEAAPYLQWSPDGSRLAVAEIAKSEYLENFVGNNHPLNTYALHIYNNTGKQLGEATLEDISSMKWSPDSSLLAVGLDRFELKIYSRDGSERYSLSTPFPQPGQKAANGALWGKFTSPNNTGSVDVAWSPDGRMLASAAGEPYSQTPVLSAEGAVRLWDPATGQLAGTIKVPAALASLYTDESGNPLSTAWVHRVQWTPAGHLFLPDGGGVWDVASGRRVEELAELKSSTPSWPPTEYPFILDAQWSPDGKTFAFADGSSILLCNPVTGELRRSIPDALPPSPVATTPPKTPLSEEEVRATIEAKMADNYDTLYSLAWSPDSSRVAGLSSGVIRVWDAASGNRLVTIRTQTTKLAWSPDSRVLVTLGYPGTFPDPAPGGDQQPPPLGIDLWDASIGRELRSIAAESSVSFAWSPDGLALAVSTTEGVQIWGVPLQ